MRIVEGLTCHTYIKNNNKIFLKYFKTSKVIVLSKSTIYFKLVLKILVNYKP